MEFTPHDLRHLRVTRAVTKIRKEAKGDAAEEAASLEGFRELMAWRGRETMATYIKTMNKRQAIKAVLDDEEAVAQQEQDAVTAQSEAPPAQTQPPCTAEDRSNKTAGAKPARRDDDNEFSWYEE